jgi:dihydroorotate dehydrogenase electron transfer subunit
MSDECKCKKEMPKVFRISKIVDENYYIKTFYFNEKINYEPGQFVMVWLPGVDEKPFSISVVGEDYFGISIEKKGYYTEKIHELKVGDKLGIRGPYGKGFKLVEGKCVVVAGGCGIAPVMPLVKKLNECTVIVGCRSADRLFLMMKIVSLLSAQMMGVRDIEVIQLTNLKRFWKMKKLIVFTHAGLRR